MSSTFVAIKVHIMDFRLQQKSMTLNDLKRQCTALSLVHVMHVVTKHSNMVKITADKD